MPLERLQKILSAAGVASRRAAEELIREGHVEVNGKVISELGSKADPAKDRIKVDGRAIKVPDRMTYLLLYKPRGFLSTLEDPQGRPTVRDLLPPGVPRVYHVGRLDTNTEGLLLLTNDGELAQHVAHPRYGCEKTYLAKVSGIPSPEALDRLRRGVPLDGRPTAPARVDLVRSTRRDGNAWVALVLREGRSHEVRRMLESVGHKVSKLRRVRIGPLTDEGLAPGHLRTLTSAEVQKLRSASAATRPGSAQPAAGKPATAAPGLAGASRMGPAGPRSRERPGVAAAKRGPAGRAAPAAGARRPERSKTGAGPGRTGARGGADARGTGRGRGGRDGDRGGAAGKERRRG